MIWFKAYIRTGTYYGVVGVLVTAILCSFAWWQWPAPQDIPLADYNAYDCVTAPGLSAGTPGGASEPASAQASGQENRPDATFRVLTQTWLGVQELADALCQSPVLGRHFRQVTVAWHGRDHINAQTLVDEYYDVFLSREHVIAGQVPAYRDYYQPLVATGFFDIYWFSRDPMLEISQTYLQDKNLGFLADRYSQTFFLQPQKVLKQQNIQLSDEQERLYEDMHALYAAFLANEVQVISGPDIMPPEFAGTALHRVLLTKDASLGRVYLRNRWMQTALPCELLRLLPLLPYFDQASSRPLWPQACV